MAQLDDKINTTLDQVIATEWTGQGRGRVSGSLKKKSNGSGALKGQGRQVRRASKGGGKGGNAGGGKGKDSSMARGPRTKGFVKKTLFSTRRGTTAASRTSKGTVKGKSKGSRQRLAKGKGKGKGKWTGSDFDASGTGGRTLWRGGRSKGKARGKGKDTLSKWQGSGEGRSDKWKGTGNGRLKGKGKGKVKSRGNSQPSDGYGVRRSTVKRQPGMRAGISGKGKGKGMSRAFAIATGRSLGRRGT